MVNGVFEWERPLIELEQRLEELRKFTSAQGIEISEEIAVLERRAERLRREIYSSLTPWQKVMVARHPKRPTFLDYVSLVFDDFVELHGDRLFRDDGAMVGGLALFEGRPVTVIGPQKGRDTKENIARNFGLPHPEGYRKAMRLMKQAAKFGRPIISFIDVVGAFPGIEAEERGQGVAIAESIQTLSMLATPVVCVITGEGGSGGALAIGVGDRVLMLEHAWYSVISPEMCATILWRDSTRAPEAAAYLRLTAQHLLELGVVDEVIPEPLGGAHRAKEEMAARIREALRRHLGEVLAIPREELVSRRMAKYRAMGRYEELDPECAVAELRQPQAQEEPKAGQDPGGAQARRAGGEVVARKRHAPQTLAAAPEL